jgi:hypothetical protein
MKRPVVWNFMKESYLGFKFRFLNGICVKGLRKNMKPLSQNSRCVSLDLNPGYFC